LDIIKLRSLCSLKTYLIKYLATNITSIESIGIIYRIFIRRSTTIITFVNLLLLGKLTIKSIKISRHLCIGIGSSQSTLYFFYIRGLSTHTHSICLNVFLYIVMHYRLVVCLLNNFISLYIAKVPYYKRVVYKFKYLKL